MPRKYKDFDTLNILLVACFEAEKLYFNAAYDAQTTELKRFLNFMAVERNRMANTISNELSSRNIEPLKFDVSKGHMDRTWSEIKEALVHLDMKTLLQECISRDKFNVTRYDKLLDRNELPEVTLAILYKQKQQLQWYIKQVEQHQEDPDKKVAATRNEALHGTPKVIRPDVIEEDDIKIIKIKAI